MNETAADRQTYEDAAAVDDGGSYATDEDYVPNVGVRPRLSSSIPSTCSVCRTRAWRPLATKDGSTARLRACRARRLGPGASRGCARPYRVAAHDDRHAPARLRRLLPRAGRRWRCVRRAARGGWASEALRFQKEWAYLAPLNLDVAEIRLSLCLPSFCPVSVPTSACSVRTLARRVPFSPCNRSRLGERAKPRGESVMAMLKTKETLEER